MKPCFKREVCAVIVNSSGEVAVGENVIYNDKIESCPRKTGEGYEKCIVECQQMGHAETEAIRKAKLKGMEIKGATLYLHNHYKMCENCKKTCEYEGLNVVILGEGK